MCSVATAMQAEPIGGLVGEWLAPVQKFWSEHKPDSSAQEEEQKDYYCQLNARCQGVISLPKRASACAAGLAKRSLAAGACLGLSTGRWPGAGTWIRQRHRC